jgi:class 3 adenylate cyclase
MSQTRRLAAILAADLAGYSRLMGQTRKARTNASKRCAASSSTRKIAEHHGRIVKTTGDGFCGRRNRLTSSSHTAWQRWHRRRRRSFKV